MKIWPSAKGNVFFNNSFFIFIIRFLPSLANLLVLVYYSRNLDKDTYGNYQGFWIQLNILYPIACFGIHTLITTYKPGLVIYLARNIKRWQYIVYGLWMLLLAVVFALLQAKTNHLSLVVPLLFLLCFATTIIIESFLIISRVFNKAAFISMLYSIAFVWIHWWILQQGFSLTVLFQYLLIVCMARLALYIGILMSNKQEPTQNDTVPPADIRSLWLHVGFYDIIQVLFNWIDKFIISFIFTASVSAVYFNGAQNIPFLPLLLSSASSAVLIQLADKDKEQSAAHTTQLVNHASRLLSCIVFPLFFFLLCYRHQVFTILFAGRYEASVPIFLMAIMIVPLRAYGFTAVLQSYHKGAIINTGSILDLLLACALMYPLYQLMGLPGIALSFVISTYLQSTYYLYHTARTLGVSILQLIPLGNWAIKLAIYGALFATTQYLSERFAGGVFSLALGGSVMAIVMLISLGIELKAEKRKWQ